jgi:hypothetical protein
MLGGEDFTPITRDHAVEMLRQAAAPRVDIFGN